MKLLRKGRIAGIVVALVAGGPDARAALTFTNILVFDGTNGAGPKAALIEGQDGLLYGVTSAGGTSNAGVVFRMAKDSSGYTNLYSFTGGVDGGEPSGALARDAHGNLYGTTYSGGEYNAGTVFRLGKDGSFTRLASLDVTNGAGPETALVEADDGSIYGAASTGPYTNSAFHASGYGSLFRVAANGDFSVPLVLGNTNGANPRDLVRGTDGNFYATTAWGGTSIQTFSLGYGTVFRFSTNGTLTSLYSLNGGSDGGFPYGGLALGPDGNFYGTTFSGGKYAVGTIYRITPGGSFTLLHTFSGSEGAEPYAGLTLGRDGNFFGTAYSGGRGAGGTIFVVGLDGSGADLHDFNIGTEGGNPMAKLLLASDGNFYGTTSLGGPFNCGTLFRFSVPFKPAFKSIGVTNGAVILSWSAVASQKYQIQFIGGLGQTNWTNLGSLIVATNGTLSTADAAPAAASRFYRAVLVSP